NMIRNAKVTSNYAIAKVIINVLDESGSVISTVTRHVPGNPVREYEVSSLISVRDEANFSGKRLQIQAFVGSGELLTVFDGTVS
ncbi:MAG: hypothetical protein J6Z79_07325, partial [Clostridia bacterium]|nr:hypothetical protein [Clostridia bacterium]